MAFYQQLEHVTARLQGLERLLEQTGRDILLEVDWSDIAGHRYGFVYREVMKANALLRQEDEIGKEANIEMAKLAIEVAKTYLGLDVELERIVDESGYRKIIPPPVPPAKEGDDAVSILHQNVFHVLQNLNRCAKELVSYDKRPHKGQGYALTWSSLSSALKFTSDESQEKKIRVLVNDALKPAFDYVNGVMPGSSTLLIDVFRGYREGPKCDGTYIFETNVKGFCRREERAILNELALSGA